ncbi:hypothetical protein PQO03_20250 [Lentisphaera profundi]|uniref:MucB/RseB N-terminal domain-containing protein n=1 Tax=Lentisphaera profundi TaxID=1658616 RepID=A0ABY7VY69_9BACT|nr:hypothetical protein [Lentisphaera profundi]WDE98155.1 hypothetical protein PQO03_20250 [Lentisphaera profundi]
MAKVKFIFFTFFCLIASAEDKMPETELLVRRFVHALIDKNEASIRALCLDHHNLKVLWSGDKKTDDQKDQLKRELSKLDIDWLKEGESFRFGGKVHTINENMITKRHQIARVKMLEYGFPIHISNVGGSWYIQPMFVANVVQREIAVASKKNRRNYTVIIDGKEIELNEDEEGKLILSDGKELKVSMRKNLFQNFEDKALRISYSRDLVVTKTMGRNCKIYRLIGELSPSVMIQVYDKGTDLKKTENYVTNSIIENYQAMDYTLKNPPSRELKYLLNDNTVIQGREVRSMRNGVTHIDHMYFWKKDKRVIAVVLQMEISDSVAGADYLSHIINELELKTSSKQEQ